MPIYTTQVPQEEIANDAANGLFLAEELVQYKKREREVEYAPLKARDVIPADAENVDPAAEEVRYVVLDRVGAFKVISDYSEDLPSIDVNAKEFKSPIEPIGGSITYSPEEVAKGRLAGRDVVSKKQRAVDRAGEEKINSIAWYGIKEKNIPGFLSNPNIPTISASGGTFWRDKAGDDILLDMNTVTNTVRTNTKTVETPDTMLLPPSIFDLIMTKRLVDIDTTVMKFFMEHNRYIKNIEWVPELETASAAGGPLAVVYRRSPDVLGLAVPQEITPDQPYRKPRHWLVNYTGKVGGTIVYLPLACQFMDTIGPVPA